MNCKNSRELSFYSYVNTVRMQYYTLGRELQTWRQVLGQFWNVRIDDEIGKFLSQWNSIARLNSNSPVEGLVKLLRKLVRRGKIIRIKVYRGQDKKNLLLVPAGKLWNEGEKAGIESSWKQIYRGKFTLSSIHFNQLINSTNAFSQKYHLLSN